MIDKRTVFDIQDNKYEKIYKQLFDIALNKYAIKLGFLNGEDLKNKYIIVEKKNNTELLGAPKVILKSKSTPITFIKSFIDENGFEFTLEDFWPQYEFNKDKNIEIIMIDKKENHGLDELIHIDYVRGVGRFRNTYTNIEYELPLHDIPTNVRTSSSLGLSKSFLKKLRNK